MHILPFKKTFGYFKDVVVYLSCIWLFWYFFEGLIWLFLPMRLWPPGNPDTHSGH